MGQTGGSLSRRDWPRAALNQLIIVARSEALARGELAEQAEGSLLEVHHARRALGDMGVAIDTSRLRPHLWRRDALPDTDTLGPSMPR
jgi:hypothetical protein